MVICYFSNVLITPVDQSLYESTMPQGSRFGMPLWQFNQTALDDPVTHADLQSWRILNLLRGFCGFLGWLLSFSISDYDYENDPLNENYKVDPI